jgi:DNA-binding transcriptional LysR family regulator
LNFSRAAEDLGTAQPSLSQQIRHLESEIGVALFDRAKRRIALTGAGLDFLGEARALVAGLDGAVARARETARGLRGELRIAYTISAMVSTLPSAIREYRTSHPDVRITLRSMDTTSLIAALETREVDAGVFVTCRRATASRPGARSRSATWETKRSSPTRERAPKSTISSSAFAANAASSRRASRRSTGWKRSSASSPRPKGFRSCPGSTKRFASPA